MTLIQIRKSCFGDTTCKVMDFFLSNVTSFYTPLTAALSMELPHPTVKDCMRLLYQSGYLTKLSPDGTAYHITKQNMQFWAIDFKNHIMGDLE